MPNSQELYSGLALSLYCTAVEWFFYGINLVLFCLCIKALRKGHVRHRRGLSAAIGILFSFCTLHWALQLVNAGQWMGHVLDFNNLALLKRWQTVTIIMNVLYMTNNLIADGIFIYRCYHLWNRSKRVIAVPIILLVATGGLGYASVVDCGLEGFSGFLFVNWLFPMSVIFSVLSNLLLMGLTAGRIWWIARGARAIMGPHVTKQYRTVVAMILESGALYCVPGILYLVMLTVPFSTLVVYSALSQIGMAPSIIFVRVGLGESVESMESFRRTADAIGTFDIGIEKSGRDDGEDIV
ncbi:hypothetical protein C8J57DRAFT_630312 [Mycena rebaudengoi]|nr:hypothetical protein C8J57DRAFT_630312 [Mycena rebaudengoi]